MLSKQTDDCYATFFSNVFERQYQAYADTVCYDHGRIHISAAWTVDTGSCPIVYYGVCGIKDTDLEICTVIVKDVFKIATFLDF